MESGMKSETSFIVIGLAAATTALGFATVGPLPSINNTRVAPLIHIADSAGAKPAHRVYCYNGIKDLLDSLSRGWVCAPEDKRPAAN